MKQLSPLFCTLSLCAALQAQSESVVPAACADLPGNAALSMPLRWSYGTMQVRINSNLLPQNFLGKTISGLRMRRPAFFDEPAYPAMQRTLTVRGGFDSVPAAMLGQTLLANRPANVAVLFGPASVSVAATPAQGAATILGDEYLSIQFTTPLVVSAGTLFLEFEASDAPLVVSADHWVDAVWFGDGVETGYAVQVGDGSCTTRNEPTELSWNDSGSGPRVGGTAALLLTGAPPAPAGGAGTMVFTWFGIDPQPRAAAPGFVGFGNSLAGLDPGLASCHQWAPIDAVWNGTSDIAGAYTTSFPLVSGATTIGMRIGLQAAWLDQSRPGLPISVSNGLMLVLDEIGVGNDCATQFFPGSTMLSPWYRFGGQMPVLVFEHN